MDLLGSGCGFAGSVFFCSVFGFFGGFWFSFGVRVPLLFCFVACFVGGAAGGLVVGRLVCCRLVFCAVSSAAFVWFEGLVAF